MCLNVFVAFEVVWAEVAVLHAVLEHVVGGSEQGRGDGEDGLVGSPAWARPELAEVGRRTLFRSLNVLRIEVPFFA